MIDSAFAAPGDLLLRRSRRGELVTWVQAARVVNDDDSGLLMWIPEGAGFGCRVDDHGQAIREEPIDVVAGCALAAGRWKINSVLIWNPPGAAHSLWWFFPEGRFCGWYVNLEIQGARWVENSLRGVDVTDLGLDVVIDPDRSWRWKDEAGFAAFTGTAGYWSVEEAAAARAEGRRLIGLAEQGRFPFDGTRVDFTPDPAWAVPQLPPEWDRPPGDVSGSVVTGRP